MLDIIRKKASAWGVKVIFGIIIIVFIFFFGYSRISQKTGGGSVVARVNGDVIGRPEYQLAYENTYKMYENIFKGSSGEGLAESMAKNAQRSAVQQLVTRAVLKQLGRKLDMEPTNAEVIDVIRTSSIAVGEDGKFDPFLYKQRFLPYFAQKYGVDYEALVEGDLIFQNVQDVFRSAAKAPAPRAIYDMEKTKYSFSVSEYDSEDSARAGRKGKSLKTEPVNIAGRNGLFPTEPDPSVFEKIFSLAKDGPPLDAPVAAGGKWYTVKLVKVDKPSDAQWEKDKAEFSAKLSTAGEQQFYEAWVTSLLKKAKVKTYIE